MNAARAIIVAFLLCWGGIAAADVAVPALTGRVVDQTSTLTPDQTASIEQTLATFEARKGSQIAVLIVPTTAPETIEQFSIRVAEQWKIGRKKIDDGALLVIAKDDRHLRIEVGYGFEGALTDVTAKRSIDEIITPKFKTGDFAGGISAGIDRIIRVADGELLPEPKRQQRDSGMFDGIDPFNPFLIIAVFVFGGIMRTAFGRLFGSLATGGLAGIVAWFLFGTLLASGITGVIAFIFTLVGDTILSSGGVRRGGWSGGGWSGGGGSFSGGSGGGGFSGGGGSFGGGGASGSW
jgi:uncharacterized protein